MRRTTQTAPLTRRALVTSTASAALIGLTGCSSQSGERSSTPSTPPTTSSPPTSQTATSSPPTTDSLPSTTTEPERTDPEDFQDGSGTAGPGKSVSGTRDGIEFVIHPSDVQPGTSAWSGGQGAKTRLAAFSPQEMVGTAPLVDVLPSHAASNSVCHLQPSEASNTATHILNLNPTTARIFPGSLLQIDSVLTGQLQPVMADRAPIRLSISLPGTQFEGSASRVISSPSLSTIRDGINDLVRSVNPDSISAADIDHELSTIYARQQNHVALGVHFNGLGNTFGFDFDSTSRSTTTRVFVKFVQRYYSVDVDIPNAFFADGRTPSNGEAIVSSVTYGRMLLFAAESTESVEAVRAALEAGFSGVVGGNASAEHDAVLKKTRLHVTALGGSGSAASQPINNGLAGIRRYVEQDADFSPATPAYPLSYQLTYLSDFSIATTDMRTEFSRRLCDPVRLYVRDLTFTGVRTYDSWRDRENEVYGTVRLQALGPSNEDGSDTSVLAEQTLWNVGKTDESIIKLQQGQQPYRYTEGTVFEYPSDGGDIAPSARLRLTADLYEFDGTDRPGEHIGSLSRDVLLSDVLLNTERESSTIQLEVNSDRITIEVACSLERLQNSL